MLCITTNTRQQRERLAQTRHLYMHVQTNPCIQQAYDSRVTHCPEHANAHSIDNSLHLFTFGHHSDARSATSMLWRHHPECTTAAKRLDNEYEPRSQSPNHSQSLNTVAAHTMPPLDLTTPSDFTPPAAKRLDDRNWGNKLICVQTNFHGQFTRTPVSARHHLVPNGR